MRAKFINNRWREHTAQCVGFGNVSCQLWSSSAQLNLTRYTPAAHKAGESQCLSGKGKTVGPLRLSASRKWPRGHIPTLYTLLPNLGTGLHGPSCCGGLCGTRLYLEDVLGGPYTTKREREGRVLTCWHVFMLQHQDFWVIYHTEIIDISTSPFAMIY